MVLEVEDEHVDVDGEAPQGPVTTKSSFAVASAPPQQALEEVVNNPVVAFVKEDGGEKHEDDAE